tara:strand:+ start:415 stop:795 length:381 start_codon:yes stop_codon:yes gene_type:complete
MNKKEAEAILESPDEYSKKEVMEAKRTMRPDANEVPGMGILITMRSGQSPKEKEGGKEQDKRKRSKGEKKPTMMRGGVSKMAKGGMANGKVHNYVAGGSVTDKLNPGLRALQKVRPDVVKNILKKS